MIKTNDDFANLMNRFDNPVDPRVAADDCVLWVDEDNFKVFVR